MSKHEKKHRAETDTGGLSYSFLPSDVSTMTNVLLFVVLIATIGAGLFLLIDGGISNQGLFL